MARLPSLRPEFQSLPAPFANLPFYIIVLGRRGPRRGRRGLCHRSRALGAGDLRQAGPRQQSLRRRFDISAAPPEPVRRHPHHLRPFDPAFPQIIFNALGKWAGHPTHRFMVADLWRLLLTPPSWFYGVFYFVMVVLFTYFYTAVTFDPKHDLRESPAKRSFHPRRASRRAYPGLSRPTSSRASPWSALSSSVAWLSCLSSSKASRLTARSLWPSAAPRS